ncbi:MAG: DNA helicase II [Gammaproteobacteria bacterium]|nr:DNA helicase II [Gammaproteobacteria bacterium]
MDVSPILDPLNEAQREAVASEMLPALVIAGAGSGKTRVLVHRIAWLCEVESVSPYSILAVTFTNKAAAEMRSRVESLLESSLGGMWIGTFHGISHRLLRTHWQEAKLKQSFQILDSDDQLRLVKRVILGLGLDDTKWPAKHARWYINGRKEEGQRPQHIQDHGDVTDRQLIRIYTAYQAACEQTGLVDFAELLLRSLELLQQNPEISTHYKAKFRHILVDEFQDTNSIQYQWLKVFAGEENPIFAVGDDDQSIYGWRGARIENIHSFESDYKQAQIFKLEQNYRSTNTILSAANSLIGNNQSRMGKKLWTEGGDGEPIYLYTAFNEQDEARFVADKIKHWVETCNGRRDEAAILYRSNAQSRVFEEVFITQSIPYRVYGGFRFFERAEIKDALAYLRLSKNSADDPSFERIVNVPTRGIGQRTVAMLRDFSKQHQLTLWEAAEKILQASLLAARASNALQEFMRLMHKLRHDIDGLELDEQVDHIIQVSGLVKHHGRDGSEKSKSRVENLEELVVAARGFHMDDELYEGMQPLDAFLTHASLEAGEGQGAQWDDCVQLMTLHASKGLEFPLVFIVGLEDGLFPSSMSMEEPGRLEEERRLCYVGITRARQQLVLTYAESRRQYGSDNYNPPSRFISEVPAELIAEVRPRAAVTKPTVRASFQANSFAAETGVKIGARVTHVKFGEGVVLDCEGKGSSARVQVHFENVGSKWLVLAYANLDMLA